ncbi:efflux RND transporter periplasmic adaptor subunit [Dawidia soli]|uniref:Efflux RND transporter periplasmic adaptor subunit n=1 Tax=Dawidia soli TaxID=2782352 RepID=A0AAP2DAE3_9BACT|nr:efflux RND transporter periplasmic adaptor subunit [Dawidia soli]MBT1688398.1 efflux RND transporter periplasmic adaptor subunit [Dawidia soli]
MIALPMNAYLNTLKITGALVLAASLVRCSTSAGGAGGNKAPQAAPAVETVSLKKGLLSSTLSVPGELISYQQVDLYARETSFVKTIVVDVGSEVKEGQVLASLEAPEISSRLAGAESRGKSQEAVYLASKAHYERLLETSKTPGTISPHDLDQARARMNSALVQLEAARATQREVGNTRDYLTIRAPFAGVITARNVNPGAYVGPSGRGSEKPMFTLQEQKHLRLVVSVPEAYTAYLSLHDTVDFYVKSQPDKAFQARVARLAGALDTRLRAERIEMDVTNDNKRLLPGMIADVVVPLPAKDSTFIVPKRAVVNAPEKVFIIKVVGGKAQWTPVRTGRTIDGKTEVYGDLRVGDEIVLAASEEVRDGSDVPQTKAVQ